VHHVYARMLQDTTICIVNKSVCRLLIQHQRFLAEVKAAYNMPRMTLISEDGVRRMAEVRLSLHLYAFRFSVCGLWDVFVLHCRLRELGVCGIHSGFPCVELWHVFLHACDLPVGSLLWHVPCLLGGPKLACCAIAG
jgi:hypothetical protein